MRILLFLLISTFSIKLSAQIAPIENLISGEAIERVMFIKYGTETASGFIVSIDKHDYLITAKHLFPGISSKTRLTIYLYYGRGWSAVNCALLIHPNPNIDIAVLDLMTNDVKENYFDLNGVVTMSQECFFLGFPFGLKVDDESNVNHGFPIPFIKKAIVSASLTDSSSVTQVFLDGHNNPGFSGGPVVVINNIKSSANIHRMSVIAVVSAYLGENKLIKTPLGSFINSENSGIIVTYSIRHVFEIIKANK